MPDDVLILILGQLDLITQLEMTHVHIRFLMLMPLVWRSQCRSTTLSLIELHLSDKDLRFFLGSNRETFQMLRLKMEKRVNFDILTSYIFPNIHDFRFSTCMFWLNDSDIPRIIRAFPNLRTFSPYGSFTGQYMQDFTSLENLTLSYCRTFKMANLIPIMETRKLKGLKLGMLDDEHLKTTKLPLEGIRHLEVLQCDTEEMARWFLEHMEHLTKLKKLFFCGPISWHVVRRVLNSSNRKTIKCLQINTSGADLFNFFPSLTVQIHTLQMANAVIPLNKMPNTTVNLNINQIYLKRCDISEQVYFDKLLKDLKTLEILGLDGCIFCFGAYTFSVKEIVRNRGTALHVHLNQNLYLDSTDIIDKTLPMLWNVEGEHSLFKLHEGTLNITYGCENVAIYFE
ncbi:hypothetical protein KR200_004798 [Drosophila serrata]|nr:hypothetical protein KR200_004798 [Drosophila serrata]